MFVNKGQIMRIEGSQYLALQVPLTEIPTRSISIIPTSSSTFSKPISEFNITSIASICALAITLLISCIFALIIWTPEKKIDKKENDEPNPPTDIEPSADAKPFADTKLSKDTKSPANAKPSTDANTPTGPNLHKKQPSILKDLESKKARLKSPKKIQSVIRRDRKRPTRKPRTPSHAPVDQ